MKGKSIVISLALSLALGSTATTSVYAMDEATESSSVEASVIDETEGEKVEPEVDLEASNREDEALPGESAEENKEDLFTEDVIAEDTVGEGQVQELDLSDAMIFGGLPASSDASEDITSQMYMDDGSESIYDVIAAGIEDEADTIDVSGFGISQDTFTADNPIVGVLNDNPQFFYVEGATLDIDDSGEVFAINMFYEPSAASLRAEFDTRVNEIVNQVEPSWTQVQKALFVHDYLVTTIDYDSSLQRFSAFDALVNHSCVCQGYTSAYMYIMRKLGIESRLISSYAMGHAWNLVKVDGKYYYVDCTWDDPANYRVKEYCGHNHFLVSREKLAEDHNSTDWELYEYDLSPYDSWLVAEDFPNAYRQVQTSSDMDDMRWRDSKTPVSMVGRTGYFIAPSELNWNYEALQFDFDSLSVSQNYGSIPYASGYVQNGIAVKDGTVYVSNVRQIFTTSSTGYTPVYEYLGDGDIFSLKNSNGSIWFDVYTDYGSGGFVGRYNLDTAIIDSGSGEAANPQYPDMGWVVENGIFYWCENKTKQGTKLDPHGVLGFGTNRGREIYDPVSNGWYWLDSEYDGAKACNKEVWMPYIYQEEDTWDTEKIRQVAYDSGDLGPQVERAITSKAGKWVRYDAEGKMIKGWYDADPNLYPTQRGNRYYYDQQTGLMAKGLTTIGGKDYYFDPVTGALRR